MKSVDTNLTSIEVKAKTRPLRCSWTVEMATDLNSYHGVSLEREIERIFRIEKRKKSIKNIFPEQKP